MLTTSATLLDAAARESIDLAGEDPEEPVEPPAVDDPRPWLVLVDGRGRLTRLGWLRGQPFWRDVLVLCRQSTPADHLNRLRRHHVEHLVAGIEHVDLGGALDQLADRYGVREVRTDAGGTLNGLLWRAGLVDEVSVVVAPQLAGAGQVPAVHLVEGLTGTDAPQLTLVSVERLPDSHVWLRYTATLHEPPNSVGRQAGPERRSRVVVHSVPGGSPSRVEDPPT